jgi:predicted XRE-type DNA-binding protein
MKTKEFTGVWDAIENTPQQAASLRACAALMMEREALIKERGMTQGEAAKLFGVTQPRISDLMRGKIISSRSTPSWIWRRPPATGRH